MTACSDGCVEAARAVTLGFAFQSARVPERHRNRRPKSREPQSPADLLYSLHIEMFCYWGDEVIPGFGLVKADGVKKTSSGVFFCSPKSSIRRIAPGKGLVGFVRGEGNVSVISVPPAGGLQRDRLSMCFSRTLDMDGAVSE